MEKKTMKERIKETPIGVILVLLILFLLITTLPVIVNGLVKIDWFKDSVSGGEGDWLSFYGSYLGGILGGILTLVGVVLTIRYQDRIRAKDMKQQSNREQYIMDSLLGRASLSLLNIYNLSNEQSLHWQEYISKIRVEKNNYNEIMREIDTFSVETLPHNVLRAFTALREDLKLFNLEIDYIFERRISSDKHLYNQLNSLNIQGLLKSVLTIHKEIAIKTTTIDFLINELELINKKETSK